MAPTSTGTKGLPSGGIETRARRRSTADKTAAAERRGRRPTAPTAAGADESAAKHRRAPPPPKGKKKAAEGTKKRGSRVAVDSDRREEAEEEEEEEAPGGNGKRRKETRVSLQKKILKGKPPSEADREREPPSSDVKKEASGAEGKEGEKKAAQTKVAQGQIQETGSGGLTRAAAIEENLVVREAGLGANTLEKGHIYFFYRPRAQRTEARSPNDVARMYVILNPVASRPTGMVVDKALQANETGKSDTRIIIISKKKLPNPGAHERFWGFVAKASKDIRQLDDLLMEEHYDTKTRNTRDIPGARPLGAGVYSIVTYHNNAHLSYVLEIPQKPADVQESFNIEKEGSFIFSVRNPDTPSPPQAGLKGDSKASFPKHLKDVFHGRRFIPADPVEFLDHDGCELLLIGAHKDLGPMGKCADELLSLGEAEEEKIRAVGSENAVFSELRADAKNFRPEPLFGMWA